VFPPPQPWKQLATVDPDQKYLAFTSRFALRSWLRFPAFMVASTKIMKQVESAPGALGYSLGVHLPGLYFYTLSAWKDDESLRAFSRAMQHGEALRVFHRDMRMPSPFIRWPVRGADLPLRWPDALERITVNDKQGRTAPTT
jgi:hypothetical protein